MSSTFENQDKRRAGGEVFGETGEFVTFHIAEQHFGIPVLTVQDVLNSHRITRIPLAPPEIAGSLNLRGRIVTAIDVRCRLNLPSRKASDCMSVVVDHDGELYSLLVDSVGEVLALNTSDFERNPPTLERVFREYSLGIYRLKDKLLVVLDVDRLLDFGRQQVA